jgi:polyhydroxyalkanoate synthase
MERHMNQAHWWFKSLDSMRRHRGNTLDRMGLGPQETQFDLVFSRAGLRLRHYTGHAANNDAKAGPPLLIVPSPIKRPYIWDLAPERSVVRKAIAHGLDVYMVEWTETEQENLCPSLADYAGPMIEDCIGFITAHTGHSKVFLTGHSLGGIFTALFGAYRPELLQALVLIDVPLHFNEATGAFGKMLEKEGAAEELLATANDVPGSLLSMISANAAPSTFYTSRYLDRLASLPSHDLTRTHWRVERWTMDEFPMSRALFIDVVEKLYRGNEFMLGAMKIGDTPLHPKNISTPLLSVYQSSDIIPADSALAFFDAAGSADKELLPYSGDTGVALQHVGPLVGDSAHRDIWPRIFSRLEELGERRT